MSHHNQGLREGGRGGTMTSGPMGFRVALMGLVDFRRPIEMTLRNQGVEDGRPFLFLRSHRNSEKMVTFFLVDLFFSEIASKS